METFFLNQWRGPLNPQVNIPSNDRSFSKLKANKQKFKILLGWPCFKINVKNICFILYSVATLFLKGRVLVSVD